MEGKIIGKYTTDRTSSAGYPMDSTLRNIEVVLNNPFLICSGEFVSEYTSGTAGIIFAPKLAEDQYTVVEIAAPDGYLLDNLPQKVRQGKRRHYPESQ